MKLRARLVTSALLITAILLAVLWVVQRSAESRALHDTLAEAALAHMQTGGRARCEAEPEKWMAGGFRGPPPPGGPMRGPPPEEREPERRREPPPPYFGLQLFAYDAQLRSANPQAPALLASTALQDFELDGRAGKQLLVRMPWSEGPCSVVLVRRLEPGPHRFPDRAPPRSLAMALGLCVTGGAVFLALGPLIRRLRRLTERVRSLASADYQGEVSEPGQDEVAELSRAFDAAAKEIRAGLLLHQQKEKALREFLENTTHDVAIPLSVLMGHLSSLRDGLDRGAPVERERLGSAMDEAHHIGALLHNLALAARIDAGEAKLTRSRVDLNDIVRRCEARLRSVAAEAHISLAAATPEVPTWVEADATLVEQALSNLLSNAIRHNLPGRHAAVVLDVTGERFELRVLDDGPGIPPEEREAAMQRYARGNTARTRAPGGRGLGLSITSQVAHAHGWEFQLGASEEGGVEARIQGSLWTEPA